MRKLVKAALVMAIIGFVLIGCAPKEEAKAAPAAPAATVAPAAAVTVKSEVRTVKPDYTPGSVWQVIGARAGETLFEPNIPPPLPSYVMNLLGQLIQLW
ncbi:MAG: hypothetical protein ABIJ86_16635, partial [Spirochaetota bacterium]